MSVRLIQRFSPPVGAAPISQAVWAQTRAELTMTLRRGENVLVTLILPVLFLVFFAQFLRTPPAPFRRPIDFLLPGILAVAIMSAGMVSFGIATACERYYGVLRRLGPSPLPRWGLIAAKVVAVFAVELIQMVLLVVLGVLLYGWRPAGTAWAALPIVLLGTATFAGLGLLMAGTLRAEAAFGGGHGVFVGFLAHGGRLLPHRSFPWPPKAVLGSAPPAAP